MLDNRIGNLVWNRRRPHCIRSERPSALGKGSVKALYGSDGLRSQTGFEGNSSDPPVRFCLPKVTEHLARVARSVVMSVVQSCGREVTLVLVKS
jgi:hypothetical protein